MVIKGNARAGARSLAEHVLRVDTNERVEVAEISGVVAEDVLGALREMEAVAVCTNTKRPLYHASINTPIEEKLTGAQRLRAIERLAEAMDLTGQPRVVVVHEKLGREHCHIIWSRTDIEHSRAIRMDHNYRTHELVARELEREFGHARVQGAHIEREGKDRPARTPGHDDMQQAGRTGLTPKQAKEEITALWRSTDSGRAFQAAIEDKGFTLARGDRRDFVVVDAHGGTHSLARRVEGAKAADIRARMADVDLQTLPSVQEVRALAQARQATVTEPRPEDEGDHRRRRPAAAADELDWTDRGGMAAQQRSALRWAEAGERGPSDARPGSAQSKRLRFSEDRGGVAKPNQAPPHKAGEKRLGFYEDKKPDKDIDRDR